MRRLSTCFLHIAALQILTTNCTDNNPPTSFTQKSYYLLELGYSCRSNNSRRDRVKSWKRKITIDNSGITLWGDKCNDAPLRTLTMSDIVTPNDPDNTIIFSEDIYMLYREEPSL